MLTNEEAGDGAGSALVKHIDVAVGELLNGLQEVAFRVLEAVDDRLLRVVGKLWVPDDELVQVISEEVSA